MPDDYLSQFTPFLALLIALGASLALAAYGLRRNRQLGQEVSNLRQMADFFDSLLISQRRYPLWVWADGRVQVTDGAKSLLRLHGNVDSLDDLVGDDTYGLPRDMIEGVRAGFSGGHRSQQPYVARYRSDFAAADADETNLPVLVLVERLTTLSEKWPVTVLWVEERPVPKPIMSTPVNTANTDAALFSNWTGLKALEERVGEMTGRLNALPMPVWVRRSDGSLSDVNMAYVRAVDGETSLEVLQSGKDMFKHDAVGSAVQALRDGKPTQARHFAVVGGQRRAFHVTHVPLDSEHVLGVAIDVTGENEALAELSRVLEAQAETLNRLRSPVAIFGPDKTLRFFNNAFARLSGLSTEWLSSERTHAELLDAMRDKRQLPEHASYRDWRAGILKYYTSLIEPVEEMWHLPNGSAHRVITQPHPLGGLLVLFEDMTDKMVLEQSYNTLIAVQQETLDNMKEGVAVVGSDGRVRLANPAFAQLWQIDAGVLAKEPRLNDLLARVPVRRSDPAMRQLPTMLTNWLSERKAQEGRWYRSDDTVVDISITPLPDGGTLITQIDTTDSFRIEQALRERSRALEVADRLKSRFITSMSYELRTPLNSIIGFSELLTQQIFGPLNPRQIEYVGDILKASRDLKAMISDVLDLAVIEAGEVKLDIENVDLVASVNESSLLVQEMAHKANIVLVTQVSDGVEVIMGDKRRLKQAFYNMVSAMVSMARLGGVMTVAIAVDGNDVIVRVDNPDCGLSKIEREGLLSAVELGGMPQSRRATGLDLALVRSIVRLHGGTVHMEPLEGLGVSLVCRLPKTQKPTRVISSQQAS